MGSQLTSVKSKFEIPFLPKVQRSVKVEPRTCELHEEDVNNKRKNDMGDVSSHEMTLKELQERFKKKKKLLKGSGAKKQDISTGSCFDKKQDHGNAEMKEDESDLEKVPLSAWKRRVPNKGKAKQKSTRKHVFSSLESGVSVEAISDPVQFASEDSSPTVRNKHDPVNIEIEISKTDCSDGKNIACTVAKGSALMKDIFQMLPDEKPESVTGGEKEGLESNSISTDSQRYGVNETSVEYMKFWGPTSISPNETVTFGKIRDLKFPEMINESLDVPISELTIEGDVITHITSSHSGEPISFTRDLCSETHENRKGYIPQTEMSCPIDCDAAVQLSDMDIDDSFPSKELDCDDCSSVSEGKGGVDCNPDTTTHLKDNDIGDLGSPSISFNNSFPSPNLHTGLTLAENHSFCTNDGQNSAGADEELDCLSITSSNPSNEFTPRELFESAQPDCLPRKLLSRRRAISPTSQEKLRQAVNFGELCESAGNFRSDLEEAKVCPGEADGKAKNKSNGLSKSVPKGILKASPISVRRSRDGIESSSIPARAQKAVAFSQRQMQDMESLAVKLMNELKSMKDIVEESLCPKEYTSTPRKYTADEMRVAIQNAGEVEETTKRWLSMMSRDCNRFCKIMRSTGKTTSVERKKITFADEAGGLLCDVKILEDHPNSVFVPESGSVQ